MTLSSEDVSERSASPRRASQQGSMSRLGFKPNQSLRRSLFSSEPFPPSSTPLALNRKTNGNVFKEAFDSILSPIKQMQQKEAVAPKAIQLHSFKQIEQDLEQMFGVKEISSSQKPVIPAEQCVVQLERMQVEEGATTGHQSQQESVASVASNRTNFNHCSMIETPIARRNGRQNPECNEELAQRLRLCETTSDESTEMPPNHTDDVPIPTEAEVFAQPGQSVANTTARHPSMESESRTPKSKKPNRNSQPAVLDTSGLIENRTPSETSQTCNDSISKTLDPAVMKSFRNLSKRPLVQDQPQLIESFKFAQPKRRKAVSGAVTSSTAKYLDMTKQKVAKKTKGNRATVNKKRTLYSQEDDESDERASSSHQNLVVENTGVAEQIEESQQKDDSNSKLRKTNKRVKGPRKNELAKASSSEETSDTDEEKEDEGFDSENFHESYNDIRYDPYERGCQRPGLRVRRYANPYWINDGTAKNYAVTYGAMTKRLCKEEEKNARVGGTADIEPTTTEIAKSGSAMVINAFASLREARQHRAGRKTAVARKAGKFVSKDSETDSSKGEQSTAKSGYSFASVVHAIASSKKTESSVMRDSYSKFISHPLKFLLDLFCSRFGTNQQRSVPRLWWWIILWALYRR